MNLQELPYSIFDISTISNDYKSYAIDLFVMDLAPLRHTDQKLKEMLSRYLILNHRYYPGDVLKNIFLRELDESLDLTPKDILFELSKKLPWTFDLVKIEDEEVFLFYSEPGQISMENEEFFGYFFFYRLLHTSVTNIERFHEYHLINSFKYELDQYCQFLLDGFIRFADLVALPKSVKELSNNWIVCITRESRKISRNVKSGKLDGHLIGKLKYQEREDEMLITIWKEDSTTDLINELKNRLYERKFISLLDNGEYQWNKKKVRLFALSEVLRDKLLHNEDHRVITRAFSNEFNLPPPYPYQTFKRTPEALRRVEKHKPVFQNIINSLLQ
jgi:hypothetical protein